MVWTSESGVCVLVAETLVRKRFESEETVAGTATVEAEEAHHIPG